MIYYGVMKKCNKCTTEKELVFFSRDKYKRDGKYTLCCLCKNENRRSKNEQYKLMKYRWNQVNKEKCREYSRIKYERNRLITNKGKNSPIEKDPILNRQRRLNRKNYIQWWKMTLNSEYRIKKNLRIRLSKACSRGLKKSSAWKDLGMNMDEFKEYLSNKFYGNMTWDNYGKEWEIDHIIPLKYFDLNNADEVKIACHYSNLQPLTRIENISKKDKIYDLEKKNEVDLKLKYIREQKANETKGMNDL